jgi:hypothetical protein
MVLPAATAAGRVIAGSAKTATRTGATSSGAGGRNGARTTIRDRRAMRREAALEASRLKETDADAVHTNRIVRTRPGQPITNRLQAQAVTNGGGTELVKTNVRRLRAATATISVMSFYLWFYLIQLGCGMVFIVANYAEGTWVGWFIAGDTISMLGWTICSIISLSFMFIAIVTLVTVRAKVGQGLTMLMFLIGIAGSIVPYFNLLPWPAFFMAVAVLNQK